MTAPVYFRWAFAVATQEKPSKAFENALDLSDLLPEDDREGQYRDPNFVRLFSSTGIQQASFLAAAIQQTGGKDVEQTWETFNQIQGQHFSWDNEPAGTHLIRQRMRAFAGVAPFALGQIVKPCGIASDILSAIRYRSFEYIRRSIEDQANRTANNRPTRLSFGTGDFLETSVARKQAKALGDAAAGFIDRTKGTLFNAGAHMNAAFASIATYEVPQILLLAGQPLEASEKLIKYSLDESLSEQLRGICRAQSIAVRFQNKALYEAQAGEELDPVQLVASYLIAIKQIASAGLQDPTTKQWLERTIPGHAAQMDKLWPNLIQAQRKFHMEILGITHPASPESPAV